MRFETLPDIDTAEVDALLMDGGRVRVLPVAELRDIDPTTLRVWMHVRAVYLLPSVELVAELRDMIGNRKAIEVGSGNGALGRALGIPCTDNYCQTFPYYADQYAKGRQPTVDYGTDVERLECESAIRRHRPEVVLGSWITQRTHLTGKGRPCGDGHVHGFREGRILKARSVETMIQIVNLATHATKRSLRWTDPGPVLWPSPFIVSRGDPALDRIAIWDCEWPRVSSTQARPSRR